MATSRRLVASAVVAVAPGAVLLAAQRELPDVPGSLVSRTAVAAAPMSGSAHVTLPSSGMPSAPPALVRFARDRVGRVRVDQFRAGASGPSSSSPLRSLVQLDANPSSMVLLDHERRVFVRVGAGFGTMLVGGGSYFSVPRSARETLSAQSAWTVAAFHGLDGDAVREDVLRPQLMAGEPVHGRRLSVALPPGAEGNDVTVPLVEERWYAPALGVTMLARLTDPRFGTAEYRITALSRVEPPVDAFTVPDAYAEDAITQAATMVWSNWRRPAYR